MIFVNLLSNMSCIQSSSTTSSEGFGPFHIDYVYFYECQCQDYKIIGGSILILWVLYLINILGSTASDYFSPTLSSICQNYKIRYDIAGVTLLAFGNGAPDVFSTITSFGDNGDISVGIGALTGASVL